MVRGIVLLLPAVCFMLSTDL